MIDPIGQKIRIQEEKEASVPYSMKVAKRVAQAAVLAGATCALFEYGPQVQQYLDALMHSPEPSNTVMELSRGELALGAGYMAAVGAAWLSLDHFVTEHFNTLRQQNYKR